MTKKQLRNKKSAAAAEAAEGADGVERAPEAEEAEPPKKLARGRYSLRVNNNSYDKTT